MRIPRRCERLAIEHGRTPRCSQQRMKLVHPHDHDITYITITQLNVAAQEKPLSYHVNCVGFADGCVQRAVRSNLAFAEHLNEQLRGTELYLTQHAKLDDPQAFRRLQSVPGIGPNLAMSCRRLNIVASGGCPGVRQLIRFYRQPRLANGLDPRERDLREHTPRGTRLSHDVSQ